MTATIRRLDHVNVRTANLEAMTEWYGRVLGMKPGRRPDFGFPGAWLYADGNPIIHLVGVKESPGADVGDLRIEHFALSATGLKAMLARLEAEGERHRLNPIRDLGILQVNVWDPDGNHIHVDFDIAEAAGIEV